MIKNSTLAVLILWALVGGCSISTAGEIEDAAEAAAETWLGLVDQEDYGRSWEEASTYFRQVVSREMWERSAKTARSPLGELISRKVLSATFATTLPGAPDGEYVVIKYATSFSKKKSAIETVTPMKDADGTWRVSGYFVK